jgi:hypothetical protein
VLIMTNATNNIHISVISIYPISYQGGGDYRGIYDIGFKGALWGYTGLLLNAPYKIDSMVWMKMMMMLCVSVFLLILCCCFGYRNQGRKGEWGNRKMGYPGFLGILRV